MLVRVEAESAHVVLCVLGPDRLEDPDRHHVLRLGERGAQAHRPLVLAVVVLRLPGLAAGGAGVEEQRRVVDHGGWLFRDRHGGGVRQDPGAKDCAA